MNICNLACDLTKIAKDMLLAVPSIVKRNRDTRSQGSSKCRNCKLKSNVIINRYDNGSRREDKKGPKIVREIKYKKKRYKRSSTSWRWWVEIRRRVIGAD